MFERSLTFFLLWISVLFPSGRSLKRPWLHRPCSRPRWAHRPSSPDKRTKTVLTFVSTSGISIFWNWSFLHSRLSNWIDKFGLLIYIGFRSSAYTLSITHHLWLINYESVIGSSPKSQVHRVFQVHFSQFLDDRKVLCLYKWTYGCLFFMPKGENKWNQTVTHHFSAFDLIHRPFIYSWIFVEISILVENGHFLLFLMKYC